MTNDLPPPISSRNLSHVSRPDGTFAPPSHPMIEKMDPGAPLISFRDISIGFDDRDVLHGVSFDVRHGETKVLLGETGTGKTLLMKMAAGLIRPDSGTVLVMGHDVTTMGEKELLNFRREIGFVFQEGALFDSMTVAENVSFRLREENTDEEEIDSRVRESLRFVEMEQAIDRYPAELSGGMRRRVSIARALVDRPPIVFYDSPTAGLDPITANTIINLIIKQRDSLNMAAIMVTYRYQDGHLMANFRYNPNSGHIEHAASMDATPGGGDNPTKTEFLVMNEGRLVFEGSQEELRATRDPYIRKFVK